MVCGIYPSLRINSSYFSASVYWHAQIVSTLPFPRTGPPAFFSAETSSPYPQARLRRTPLSSCCPSSTGPLRHTWTARWPPRRCCKRWPGR